MMQATEQPAIPPRYTSGSCPACGCWDVVITGNDISCARCGKVSKITKICEAAQ